MITAEDSAHRTPGLADVQISGQTVRRSLREFGLRARRPVEGPILKVRHRYARLACARARRRWRLHTPGNSAFLVMNSDFHFGLAMDVIVCTADVGKVLWTSVCKSPTSWEEEVLWFGWNLS
jgi:hypothetical protein